MRKLLALIAVAPLAACSLQDDDGNNNYSCSDGDQKRFVRDASLDWYLWNDLLPRKKDIKVGDYDSPSALLADLISVQPLDDFSYIGSAAADQAFFGAGQYEGYGFGWKRVATDDIRLTHVFSSSPAADAGFARGQRIVAIDGRSMAEIEAAEGFEAALEGVVMASFTMRETDGVTEFTVDVTEGTVTIDPVPQWRLIPRTGTTPIAYIEFASFVSTADARLDALFADLVANDVSDVILDLRYNGGGLVATANLLGDLLGGAVAEDQIFTRTLYNADRADEHNSVQQLDRLLNSINLSRLVVIATPRTASASELVTNGLEPHVEVTIVGDRTFGKPVGQAGWEFCGNVLRLTAFQTVNADGFGDYFGGLPADCQAADDLNVPVGDAADPSLVAAETWLDTGACPPSPLQSPFDRSELRVEDARKDGPDVPWREFANAW